MSFEHRRDWHIDHIFPIACCGGDKALMERSFHFKNLRPEWGADNVRKGNRVILDGVRSAQGCGINEIHLRKIDQIDLDALELAKQIGMRVYANGGLLS